MIVDKSKILKLKSQDRCTGVMTENHISTDATIPITSGTAIPVTCDPPYLLHGSKVITCEKGIVFSHQSLRPKCLNPGKLSN